MFGYKNLVLHYVAKAAAAIVSLTLLLSFGGFLVTELGLFDAKEYLAIVAAIISGVLAVMAIFIQIRLSLKRKLESEANSEIQAALSTLANTAATTVTFSNDFVSKPLALPNRFWQDKAYDKYDKVDKEIQSIRHAYGKLFIALEAHEIAIIHIEHFYRYITIKVDEFIEKLNEGNRQMLDASTDPNLDENGYKLAVAKSYSGVTEEWVKLTVLFMDFRKSLQSNLLGAVFLRKLSPRKPYDGSSTLEQVATKERVCEMVESRERDARSAVSRN